MSISTLAELQCLKEALTPSAETKGAYSGEFEWNEECYDPEKEEIVYKTITVPWTVIKEIMKAILARAAVNPNRNAVQPNGEMWQPIENAPTYDGHPPFLIAFDDEHVELEDDAYGMEYQPYKGPVHPFVCPTHYMFIPPVPPVKPSINPKVVDDKENGLNNISVGQGAGAGGGQGGGGYIPTNFKVVDNETK